MSNFFISTASMSGAARASTLAAQEQLIDKQKEIATGKIADVGLEIGHRSNEIVSLRQTIDWSTAIKDTNAFVATRLDTSQAALADIETIASRFLDGLLAARSGASSASQVERMAQTSLTALASRLNSEISGEHVFGGLNGSALPVADYFAAGGSAARDSIHQAFQSRFGIALDDPAVDGITPGQMRDFLSDELAGEFADPAWTVRWSKASSENPIARIGLAEMQEVGASANEAPFRQLAQAFAIAGDLAGRPLQTETRAVVLAKATELIGAAMTGIASTQARLGFAQERVTSANERLSLQIDIATKRMSGIENADPYAAATELNELMRRLEASYATTARIQRLSLLDYV